MGPRDAHQEPDPDWPLVRTVQRGLEERRPQDEHEPPPLNPAATAAFGRLVKRYERRVLGFFRCKGYSLEDSKELTQESFLRVFQGMERIERSFWGVLRTTVRHVYVNDLRRRGSQSRLGDEISPEAVKGPDLRYLTLDDDQLARLVDKEEEDRIRAVIGKMPRRRRQCLDLRLQGLKVKEIAETLTISEGAVKTHLFKARESLDSARRTDPASGREVEAWDGT